MELKDRILQKSLELFLKFGFRAITMDEISLQLGMSKKTLYQYYKDKDTLIEECMLMDIENSKVDCQIASEMAENAIDEIFITMEFMNQEFKEVNPIVMHDLKKFYPSTYDTMNNHINTFYYSIIYKNLENGIKEGLYRDTIDKDIITRLRLSAVLASFDQNFFPSNKYTLLQLTQEMMDHFLHGIATDKGIKLINQYKSRNHKHE